MKNILLIILLLIATAVPAQQREAGDFTITDTEGNVLNLYDHLDAGYTVFIDLFYTTCVFCQEYAPIIEEVYQNTGAGQEDILFWGISNHSFDTDSAIDQYKLDYSVGNPCAGIEGNGAEAHDVVVEGQNFMGWPSYVIICPDRTLYFDPVHPPTVNGFDPYFEACATVGTDDNILQEDLLEVYPNPANSSLFADLSGISGSPVTMNIYSLEGHLLMEEHYLSSPVSPRIDISELAPGMYILAVSRGHSVLTRKKIVIAR